MWKTSRRFGGHRQAKISSPTVGVGFTARQASICPQESPDTGLGFTISWRVAGLITKTAGKTGLNFVKATRAGTIGSLATGFTQAACAYVLLHVASLAAGTILIGLTATGRNQVRADSQLAAILGTGIAVVAVGGLLTILAARAGPNQSG
jgi:hypothetical protein